MEKHLSKLYDAAVAAGKNSYSPYSHFAVGAALLCRSGKIYTGCNIENSAYSATVCAERVALFKAVSEGEREFDAIAIFGGTKECPPCGVCRQVLAEFCENDMPVVISKDRYLTLGELLPCAFNANVIKDNK